MTPSVRTAADFSKFKADKGNRAGVGFQFIAPLSW